MKKNMKVYEIYWAPEGRKIATVTASTGKAAKRHAPLPYRRYPGEMYVKEIGPANSLAVNPRTGHSMRVQSLLFDRATFTPAQARSWAHAHGFKYGDVEIPERGKYIHLRQLPPRGRVKRIIPIGSTLSGIRAIVLRNPLCCPL